MAHLQTALAVLKDMAMMEGSAAYQYRIEGRQDLALKHDARARAFEQAGEIVQEIFDGQYDEEDDAV
jgi:hypothetical protein